MQYKLLSIKDELIGCFMPPVATKHEEEAKRGLQKLLSIPNPDNPLVNHAQDYSLWEIGEFNDETGEITDSMNRQICSLVSLKPKDNK